MLTNVVALAPYDGIAEFHAKDIVHLKKFLGEWLLLCMGDDCRC
jgi:hypothetical protein